MRYIHGIMQGVEKVDRENYFPLSQNTRMGRPYKVYKQQSQDRQNEITQQEIKLWNSLSVDILMAISTDGFLKGLEKFMRTQVPKSTTQMSKRQRQQTSYQCQEATSWGILSLYAIYLPEQMFGHCMKDVGLDSVIQQGSSYVLTLSLK